MERVTIKIPKMLYNQLKTMVKHTGFSSVTDFIVYVLRDIVSSGDIKDTAGLTKEEIEMVRKRLRMLGYL
jgi:metal-responsive CopG/Arc/MetJ family transcriptional regulator